MLKKLEKLCLSLENLGFQLKKLSFFNYFEQFDLWLTLDDPCVTFDPRIVLHLGHRFFPPNVEGIKHC